MQARRTMTDVKLFQTPDGGEIECVAGQIALSEDGLATSAYLSLWGGNQDDTGSDADKAREWWGNKDEPDPHKHYRSETQALLRSIPAIPANLRRIEDAAARDLAWFVESGVASSVTVEARMPTVNRVDLAIVLIIEGEEFRLAFAAKWEPRTQ